MRGRERESRCDANLAKGEPTCNATLVEDRISRGEIHRYGRWSVNARRLTGIHPSRMNGPSWTTCAKSPIHP